MSYSICEKALRCEAWEADFCRRTFVRRRKSVGPATKQLGLLRMCAALSFVEVSDELKQDRRNWHREQSPEEARKRVTRDERHDDEERWHAHDLLHDEWIDEIRLELVHHHIEPHHYRAERDATSRIRDDDCEGTRDERPEDWDNHRERSEDREEKRVRYADDEEAEIHMYLGLLI